MTTFTLIRHRWDNLALIVVVIVFTSIFMAIQLRRFYFLSAQAFDLGIFQQGVWLIVNGFYPFVTIMRKLQQQTAYSFGCIEVR